MLSAAKAEVVQSAATSPHWTAEVSVGLEDWWCGKRQLARALLDRFEEGVKVQTRSTRYDTGPIRDDTRIGQKYYTLHRYVLQTPFSEGGLRVCPLAHSTRL